ncbi:hypothetical protein K402DRAFT_355961 [Aulographum hederae CBS 113979]|uniref:Large ribosomal subunit protein mL54 n=1 Tax=Aulographum hederae CBS 113979 TaxID=1176131 RepID=A0A6G1GYS1_9PEZI|nr:hypothetical protein K402DRAFT_355961 [Aulographum hederae CBS 113979]
MICHRCLHRATRISTPSLLPRAPSKTTTRLSSTSTPISPTISQTTIPRRGDLSTSPNPPAATSTSAAQPFSAALTPRATPGDVNTVKTPPIIMRSSVPAGTPLKGLNIMKGANDPVALEDSEYPEWLWGLLKTEKGGKGDGGDEGDLYSKSAKQRRKAEKRLRKAAMLNPTALAPQIPIYEQSVDLPFGAGNGNGNGNGKGSLEATLEAGKTREELRKAMRTRRRAAIKEANFLKTMA